MTREHILIPNSIPIRILATKRGSIASSFSSFAYGCSKLNFFFPGFVYLHRIISELPKCTQQLLVLLFGTFRAVSLCSSSQGSGSHAAGMSSEALGVSVAPSFFHTCVGAGRQATMDDVIRFKVPSLHLIIFLFNFFKETEEFSF